MGMNTYALLVIRHSGIKSWPKEELEATGIIVKIEFYINYIHEAYTGCRLIHKCLRTTEPGAQ